MDRIVKILFAVLLLLSGLIVTLWLSDVPENATGTTDATFRTLQRSGSTVATHPTTKWAAYGFGVCIISIFCLFLFVGGRKQQPNLRQKMYRVLSIGWGLYLLVLSLMVFSWWDYAVTNSTNYFLGLPKPTAWMVFGLLAAPSFIAFFYINQFEKWVYTPEDEQQFREIMERRTSKQYSDS